MVTVSDTAVILSAEDVQRSALFQTARSDGMQRLPLSSDRVDAIGLASWLGSRGGELSLPDAAKAIKACLHRMQCLASALGRMRMSCKLVGALRDYATTLPLTSVASAPA